MQHTRICPRYFQSHIPQCCLQADSISKWQQYGFCGFCSQKNACVDLWIDRSDAFLFIQVPSITKESSDPHAIVSKPWYEYSLPVKQQVSAVLNGSLRRSLVRVQMRSAPCLSPPGCKGRKQLRQISTTCTCRFNRNVRSKPLQTKKFVDIQGTPWNIYTRPRPIRIHLE